MKLHLPFFGEKTSVAVHQEAVEVKAFQVIVWVSVANVAMDAWDPKIPRFPAILDIGHSHNLALTESHLRRWAGIHLASLRRIGSIRKEQRRFPLHEASVWLHSDDEPFRLSIDQGISITDGAWPRLPILGLRALTNSKLQTFIYGDTMQAIIRTPPKWYWPF